MYQKLVLLTEDYDFRLLLEDLCFSDLNKFMKNPNYLWFKLKYKVDICSGVSKMVIIFHDENWVIKIPFKDYSKRYSFNDGCSNYCEREKYIYEQAVKQGVNIFFAKCDILPDIFGLTPYIMMRADIDSYATNEYIKEYYGSVLNYSKSELDNGDYCYYDDDDYIEQSMFGLFTNFYSEEIIKKFVDFLIDFSVNDLHDENIGFYNYTPYLIDYSGI